MTILWTAQEIAAATQGQASADFAASGVTFDSREVEAGHLFIAMTGETTDGHKFLDQAFANGAAGAIVSQPVAHPHVLVKDGFAALNALGRAARARSKAKICGVTGSVGKTGTKEALFAALERAAPDAVHRSVKSYNNHTGVPLSLSRMPASTRYGVFEMGMNHSGELAALTQLVRPHVAVVTTIAPAHAAFFRDEEEIADAKGEIFQGLQDGGTAIIPFDSPHYERLRRAAEPYATRIISFGRHKGADVYAKEAMVAVDGGTQITAILPEAELTYKIGLPGAHWVSNSLAVIAAVQAMGADLTAAGVALADLAGLPGRGARMQVAIGDGQALVIDESYNANPLSMKATLALLGQEQATRRLAVLGDMRELGDKSVRYHEELAEPLLASGTQFAILVGEEITPLANLLEGKIDFVHVPDAATAQQHLFGIIAPGDAVLVKGSNTIGLGRIVAALVAGEGASGKKICSI